MPEYITNLRRVVGNIPIILATAGIAVIDDKGKVLLQLRTDNGYWGLPGGCIELGETVEEAARREVFEETGLIAEKLELLNIYILVKNNIIFTQMVMKFILFVQHISQQNIQVI